MIEKQKNALPGILTDSFGQAKTVVLFGEVLADRFPDRSVLGGAPFNVAHHLKAFGLQPVLITRVGNDALRSEMLASMARFDMDTSGVQFDPVHPTGQVLVHIDTQGHRFEIPPDQAYDFVHAGLARLATLAASPAMIYFGTLAQRHQVSRRALSSLFRSTDAPRILDINLREPWFKLETIKQSLRHANLVKMSDDELAIIAGMLKLPDDKPETQARALMEQFALDRVLVTCGAKGAWQMAATGDVTFVGIEKPVGNIVDTVGAGDGFAAVFIFGTMAGWSPDRLLSRANNFAAAICQMRGAIPESLDFYQPFLKEWTNQ